MTADGRKRRQQHYADQVQRRAAEQLDGVERNRPVRPA
jgi:hypothetical protein